LPVLRLTAKTSGVASRSFRPRLKGIELAAGGAPAARMAAHIAGQIRQDQLSAEGADTVLGRLLAHKLRPARRRPRAPRGPIVGSPP
jgi:hypothetical protein